MSKTWAFDIYDSIRAVNWIRKEVAANRSCADDKELIRKLRAPFEAAERPAFLKDDSYLQPYLPDDALLPALSCESWNEERETEDSMKCEDTGSASGAGLGSSMSNGKKSGNEIDSLKAENQILREKLERQEALIEAVIPSSYASSEIVDRLMPSCTGKVLHPRRRRHRAQRRWRLCASPLSLSTPRISY
jgi:hypothetical protein